MNKPISIAIETSCRAGGVALGSGDNLVAQTSFDAASRHAVHLVAYLDELLAGAGLRPADLNELYVSSGPGSFTGLRVGITVARTLAGSLEQVRCVAVPTPQAVAQNARDLTWDNLAVVMDAKEGAVYAARFGRDGPWIVPLGEPEILPADQLAARFGRPLMLIGEGLRYHEISAGDVSLAAPPEDDVHLPTAEGVWRVGREMAAAGLFTEPDRLVPIYSRKPEAIRLWQKRHGDNE